MVRDGSNLSVFAMVWLTTCDFEIYLAHFPQKFHTFVGKALNFL